MWITGNGLIPSYARLYLRLALAAGFLASVSDRFGLWGPPGRPNVAWGDFQRFIAYTGQLNPWVPAVLIPPLAWFVTLAETILGFALALGLHTRYVALASGVLLSLFALGMTLGIGLKAALNYSVFAASSGAFALAIVDSHSWTIDTLLTQLRARRMRHHASRSLAGQSDTTRDEGEGHIPDRTQ